MIFHGFREFECFDVIDSRYASVRLYLPKRQWDYLRWLMSHGFDLTRFTKACDRRRRAIPSREIALGDLVGFATDRLHALHYAGHTDPTNLVQPVFPHQIRTALDKAERYFLNSGPDAMRWHGWTA